MNFSTIRKAVLASAIAAGMTMAGPANLAVAAPAEAAVDSGATVKRTKVRVVRSDTGVIKLPRAAQLGPSGYYWYRPDVVRREKVYLLSSEPVTTPGWFCCLMLGIAY